MIRSTVPATVAATALLSTMVLTLIAAGAWPEPTKPAPRPNLLVIVADQFRAMEMSCAGSRNVRTPNLDRLAKDGVRCDRAYANSPVCVPSRACLLTGRYPISTRVIANDLPLPEAELTLAERLRDAGYRTGYIGKWHLDGVPRSRFTPPGPRRQGFDFWAAWNCAHSYFDGQIFRDTPEPVAQTDLALEFLRGDDRRDDRKPFCLFLAWGPPHDPYYQVPERYQRMHDPERVVLRPNVPAELVVKPILNAQDRAAGMRRCIANYYAAISALDEQLGRLLEELDRSGQLRDTLVVFTSDHGDMLFSHGRLKKQQPYEEAANVPLLARWPRQLPAGRVSHTLFGTVDLAPTLLSLLGAPPLPGAEGRDLSWALRGAQGTHGAEPEAVFLMDLVASDEADGMGQREWRGLRTRRHTYARWVPELAVDETGWVLFDDRADPYQMRNLIDDPASASLRGTLEKRLRNQMTLRGDEGLTGPALIRKLGLVDLWNARERELHPANPMLIR